MPVLELGDDQLGVLMLNGNDVNPNGEDLDFQHVADDASQYHACHTDSGSIANSWPHDVPKELQHVQVNHKTRNNADDNCDERGGHGPTPAVTPPTTPMPCRS